MPTTEAGRLMADLIWTETRPQGAVRGPGLPTREEAQDMTIMREGRQ